MRDIGGASTVWPRLFVMLVILLTFAAVFSVGTVRLPTGDSVNRCVNVLTRPPPSL